MSHNRKASGPESVPPDAGSLAASFLNLSSPASKVLEKDVSSSEMTAWMWAAEDASSG